MARHDQVNLIFIDHLYQPFAATDVVADPAVGKPINHGTIIDHVSTEQHLVLLVMETNASSGMARHVENRKLTVPKVDNVAWEHKEEEERREMWNVGTGYCHCIAALTQQKLYRLMHKL